VKSIVIIALIFLVLSIGITPAIQFSDADSTIPSSKLNSDAAFTAATFADKYKDVLFTVYWQKSVCGHKDGRGIRKH